MYRYVNTPSRVFDRKTQELVPCSEISNVCRCAPNGYVDGVRVVGLHRAVEMGLVRLGPCGAWDALEWQGEA